LGGRVRKQDLTMAGCRLDLFFSGENPLAHSRQWTFGFHKRWLLSYLSDYYLLKKDSIPRSYWRHWKENQVFIIPSLVKWDLWWTKWRRGRFSPSTSVSPAIHSTNFSIFTITRGRYNRPVSGRRAEWTQFGHHPPLCKQIGVSAHMGMYPVKCKAISYSQVRKRVSGGRIND
jgi:hypothetical protein